MADTLLQTTVVGSYPQPDWLVDRKMLSKGVPRTRLRELWRVPEAFLEQAQDAATLLAIRDMERAGIDIVTDGEMRRESYSNRFATALDGIDDEHPAEIVSSRGQKTPVPRVVYFFLIVTALFSIIYWVLMPAWPLGFTYTKGLLGIDQRTTVTESLKQAA